MVGRQEKKVGIEGETKEMLVIDSGFTTPNES
jgi:hypothetical protein